MARNLQIIKTKFQQISAFLLSVWCFWTYISNAQTFPSVFKNSGTGYVDWIEFQSPMMDDVTVDPLRYSKQGALFDMTDPMFVPVEHGQSARAIRSDKSSKDRLVIDYEFTGRAGLEYLEIQTNIKMSDQGLNLGGIFHTDLPKAGVIRIRLRDPSGEIHQHTLGFPNGTQIFSAIETTPDGVWGGDGDKHLQFPCDIISIILNRPEPSFKGKGTLEISNLALYEAVELRDAIKNDEASIIGGGGDHPLHERKQIEAMFEAGALKYCDAFSIHPYRQPRTPEESGLVEEVMHIAGLMKKYGVEKPKLWITELGWPTSKKHPAKDAELFQAAMIVRSVIPLLATGVVEKYFWYDLKNDGLDRIDQEHNFGIIRHERLNSQIKPSFVAFAVTSSNTAGRNITKVTLLK